LFQDEASGIVDILESLLLVLRTVQNKRNKEKTTLLYDWKRMELLSGAGLKPDLYA